MNSKRSSGRRSGSKTKRTSFFSLSAAERSAAIERRGAQRQPGAYVSVSPYQPLDALSVSLTLPDIFWASLRPEMEGCSVPSKFYGSCAAGRPTIFVGDPNGEIAAWSSKNASAGLMCRSEIGDLPKRSSCSCRKMSGSKNMGHNARRAMETRFSKAQGARSLATASQPRDGDSGDKRGEEVSCEPSER